MRRGLLPMRPVFESSPEDAEGEAKAKAKTGEKITVTKIDT